MREKMARCPNISPDEMAVFCGSIQSAVQSQVGNAVPVNLAYEIALEIHKIIRGGKINALGG